MHRKRWVAPVRRRRQSYSRIVSSSASISNDMSPNDESPSPSSGSGSTGDGARPSSAAAAVVNFATGSAGRVAARGADGGGGDDERGTEDAEDVDARSDPDDAEPPLKGGVACLVGGAATGVGRGGCAARSGGRKVLRTVGSAFGVGATVGTARRIPSAGGREDCEAGGRDTCEALERGVEEGGAARTCCCCLAGWEVGMEVLGLVAGFSCCATSKG